MGRNKYDALSKQLGCDLAYAYVGARMEDLMVNKLVHDGMPKSSAAYIIRKAAQSSIWGLTGELMKSPLTKEIEERGEKAYHPSTTEKMSGRAVGSAVDAISMGEQAHGNPLHRLLGLTLLPVMPLIKLLIHNKRKSLRWKPLSVKVCSAVIRIFSMNLEKMRKNLMVQIMTI